jgi:hypothetical protein
LVPSKDLSNASSSFNQMKRTLLLTLAAIVVVITARADETGSLPKGDLISAPEAKIIAEAAKDGHEWFQDSRKSPSFASEIAFILETGEHHANIRGLTSGEYHQAYAATFAAAVDQDLAEAAAK